MALDNMLARRVALRRHLEGNLRADDFLVEDCSVPTTDDGTFLVRNLFASVDPMLRIFIVSKPLGNATMPVMPPGTSIPSAAVGEVIETRHPDYKVGDLVEGRFGWQNYAVSNGQGVNLVPSAIAPIENALGGLPGFTAYVGLEAAGGVKPGQTILVSGAAGAVGALVKARGGRVVGIAGGEDKRRYLIDEVGYDAVADRKSPNFHAQLAAALPDGAHVYFDNVSGPLLADLMPYMAFGSLVLISGLMAQYQTGGVSEKDNLPAVLHAVMGKGVRIQSFSQFGKDAERPAFEQEVAALLASGDFKPEIHVIEGLDSLPQAQVDLFENSTTGKVVSHLVFGKDARLALDVAKRIKTGTVNVNAFFSRARSSSGGHKMSGIGRERGVEGIRAFQEIQVMNLGSAS